VPARDQQAHHGAADGIEHHPALMQQEHGSEKCLRGAGHHVVALGDHVLPDRHAADAAGQRPANLHIGGEGQHQQHEN
jgi:hypothetical protein